MCGEYGEDFRVLIIMLFCLIVFFLTEKSIPENSGSVIYTSETLAKLWPFGFASIGDVTFESAAYCSRYIMKRKSLVILLSLIMRRSIFLLAKSLRVF